MYGNTFVRENTRQPGLHIWPPVLIITFFGRQKPMTPTTTQQKNHHFLFDAEILTEARVELFDPRYHRQQRTIQGEALGRGTTYFVRIEECGCVLRHYQRGGLIAKFVKNRYLWTGINNTRAWREWHLLKQMMDKGLPVPQPVAAHVVKKGISYQADLITLRLNNSKSLSEYLRKKPMPQEQWRNIGRVIRAFHDAGIYHADLNAHNVMLNDKNEVFLIDFDKGQLRQPNKSWQQANIERFQRSLQKLSVQISPFHFSKIEWFEFISGYDKP